MEDLVIACKLDPDKIRCHKIALEEANRLDEISLSNLPIERDRINELCGFAMVKIRSLNKHGKHLARDLIMLKYNIIFVTEICQKNFDIEGYMSAFAHGTTGRARGLEYSSKKMQTLKYVKKNYTNSSSSRLKILLFSVCTYLRDVTLEN
jgi:hypothetical protein